MTFSCPCEIGMQVDPDCPVHGRDSIGTPYGVRRRIENALATHIRDRPVLDGLVAGIEDEVAALLERIAVDLDDRSATVFREYRSGPVDSPRRADPTVLGESNGLEIAAEAIRAAARSRKPITSTTPENG